MKKLKKTNHDDLFIATLHICIMNILQKKEKYNNELVFYTGICLGTVVGVMVTNMYFYFTSDEPITPRLVRAKTRQIIAAQQPSDREQLPSNEDKHDEDKHDEETHIEDQLHEDDHVDEQSENTVLEKPNDYLMLMQMVAQNKQKKNTTEITKEEQLKKMRRLIECHSKSEKN